MAECSASTSLTPDESTDQNDTGNCLIPISEKKNNDSKTGSNVKATDIIVTKERVKTEVPERAENSLASVCSSDKKHGMEQKRKKRGMKPRSQRNRKRPRGGGVRGLGSFGDGGDDDGEGGREDSVQIEIVKLSDATRLLSERVKMDANVWGGKRVRIVRPYPFSFATFAKARWVGRPIIDVYHEEFGSYPKSYYESAINEGRILVSGEQVSCDYKIKGGDELTHTVHRHEPAVAVNDETPSPLVVSSNDTQKQKDKVSPLIKVMYEDDDVVVVDKPATLPIHPCGGYNFNSLFHIMAKQDPSLKGRLHTVHRLDRLTSGVTVVAKSTHVAKSLGKCITDRDHCHKTYVARVRGKFPLGIPTKLSRRSVICTEEISKEEERRFKNAANKPLKERPPCQYGELTDAQEESVVGSPNKEGNRNQTRPALGFWITDEAGAIHDDATVSDVFESRQNIQDLFGQDKSPSNQTECLKTITENKDMNKHTYSDSESKQRWLHLACPCRVASHKNGICEAGDFSHLSMLEATDKKSGIKPAQTSFAVVGYDVKTDSTIVLARPVTGRTHQIRLHLQYLGHPIANDPNYGGDIWYGDPAGAAACQDARERMDIMDEMGDNEEQPASACTFNNADKKMDTKHLPTSFVRPPKDATSTDVPATEAEIRNAALQKREKGESLLSFIKKTCVWCARSRGGDRVLFEFLVRSRGIWLHAIQYRMVGTNGEILTYQTDPPSWSHISVK